MDKDATQKGVSEEQQTAGAEEAQLISGEQASLDAGSGYCHLYTINAADDPLRGG